MEFVLGNQLDNSAAPHSRAFTSAVRQFETMNEDILDILDILGQGIHRSDQHQVHFRINFLCKLGVS